MRAALQDRAGTRATYTATFERWGTKTSYGYTKRTLLLVNVRNGRGDEITDHLWFTSCPTWEVLDLQPGERIVFTANAKSYWKGYAGRRDYDDEPGRRKDWKLAFPRDVRRLAGDSSAQLALF